MISTRKLVLSLVVLFSLDLAVLAAALLSLPPLPERPGRGFVSIEELPRHFIQAVLIMEDDEFYRHRGFNFSQMRAAWRESQTSGRRLRGASTISQQLAKNLYLQPDRSFSRKFKEALITIKLELFLSKDEILEHYLNSIDWGQNLIGIQRASQFYFQKDASELKPLESCFLASIIPNPARWGQLPPTEGVRRRMKIALERLYRKRVILFEDYHYALQTGL